MRVLNCHNKHQGHGGSEIVFEFVTRLLRQHGHDVREMSRDNAEISGLGAKLAAAASMVWSRKSARDMDTLLLEFSPDVVHIHNLYPQLSPSVIHACKVRGVPVVLHIHDYKLTCPSAQHLRNGKLCEKCLSSTSAWCAVHNCRGSRAMSVAYALRNMTANLLGTIKKDVTFFVPCSKFVGELLIRGGFPVDKIRPLHNCSELTDVSARQSSGGYVAYVGRISPEKGIDNLLEIARHLPGVPFKIAGELDKLADIETNAPSNVTFMGKLSRQGVGDFLNDARLAVVPSIWHEAFGLVAVEALGRGVPVVASKMGGLQEIIDHGQNGYLVEPHDIPGWVRAIQTIWNDTEKEKQMGEAGRAKVLREFSPEVYYRRLEAIYLEAMQRNRPGAITTVGGQPQTPQTSLI